MLATLKDHISFEMGNGSTGFSQNLPPNTHIKGLINVRDSVSICFSNLFKPNPSKNEDLFLNRSQCWQKDD